MITFLRKRALLAFLFLMGGIISSFADPQGSGTESDPYLIGSAEDLVWFRNLVNNSNYTACAQLTADIDLKDVCHPASDGVEEVSWTPINIFMGVFDGNDKKIKNLYYNSNNNCGFFNEFYGTIKNVCFVDVNITGTGSSTNDYGVVAATTYSNATLDNITIEGGTIQGSRHTGGCVGRASNSKITNCTNNATISANDCYIGGICGSSEGSTFINCKNLGKITAESQVGGIAGLVYGTRKSYFKDCANYGDIESIDPNYRYSTAGGIIGECYDTTLELNNVFNTGNITSPQVGYPGFILGHIEDETTTITITGTTAYNSSATLKKGDNVQSATAVGHGTLDGVLAYDAEALKTGFVTALLQQNASEGTVWGQQLGTDDYPILGSTHKVYATKDIRINCIGKMQETDDALSNTAPETEGSITTMLHCDNPVYHEAKAATCTTDGNVENYLCTICIKYFSDRDMKQPLESVTIPATGHNFVNDECIYCHKKILTLSEGTTTIQINATDVDKDKIEGFDLFKFTAPDDGTLTVYTTGDKDTYGTLWDSSLTKELTSEDEGGDDGNFKLSYTITKGTVYCIGAREFYGKEIGDYSITIELDEIPTLSEGTETIQIKAVSGDTEELSGYTGNLYKFTAQRDGLLTVYTTGDKDTYGTLWDSSLSEILINKGDGGEDSNFKLTCFVNKGAVYYIGVRQSNGDEVSDYTITTEIVTFDTPKIYEGTTTIKINAQNGGRHEITGYTGNLYKFTAPDDGTLTVYTTGDEDTYGTLWDSSLTEILEDNDDSGEGSNFKFTYEVTKGTVYYIGVRQYAGKEIGDYTITIEGTWPHEMEELTVTDKEEANIPAEYTVTTLTYKRTFNNTNWQPLYVPFAMASADWKDKGLEVACINNFHEYNTAEGKKVVLEVNKVTAGVLHPNTPYLIRATEEGEKTITLKDATVMTEEKTYTCSSMTRNYHFKGIYTEKSNLDATNDYILSGGQLMNMSEDAALSPQRWYVSVENRGSMLDDEETTAQARTIAIEVVGESSATGIEQIGVIEEDAETTAKGIYDLQGRRLNNAPTKGVYIMNGKKYVK